MTHKEKTLEIINNLPLESGFHVPNGLPVPIGQNIIIRPITQKETSLESGLVLPAGTSRKKNLTGIIYALGEDVNIPVRPGLKIDYEEFAHNQSAELNFKGETYMIIPQHAVRAICTPGSFKWPGYETSEEIRRAGRIDDMKRAEKISQSKLDELKNS